MSIPLYVLATLLKKMVRAEQNKNNEVFEDTIKTLVLTFTEQPNHNFRSIFTQHFPIPSL